MNNPIIIITIIVIITHINIRFIKYFKINPFINIILEIVILWKFRIKHYLILQFLRKYADYKQSNLINLINFI